ncbi:MAG: DUF4403 family protein [Fusobacteriaceae bacterium]
MNHCKKLILLSLIIFRAELGYSFQDISKINLEISIKKSAINEIVENEIPRNFSGDGVYTVASKNDGRSQLLSLGLSLLKNFKTDIPTKAFWRYSLDRGPIFLSAKKDLISASTDFNGKANGALENSSKNIEANFSGNLGVSTIFKISENWELSTKTSPLLNLSNSVIPLQLDIAGIKIDEKISMRSELEKRITPILQKTARDLDLKISQFNLRKFIDAEWSKLKDPILLDKDSGIWLVVRPKRASYGNILEKTDSFSFIAGTEAELFISVGKPENINQLGNLPKIYYEVKDSNSTLKLPIMIKYTALKKSLEDKFSNKVFKLFKGGEITLKKLDFDGANSNLNLKSDITFNLFSIMNFDANINLSGVPKLSTDKKILSLENFNFNIVSDSVFIKIIDKIFHNKIQNIILENYLSLNIEKDIPVLEKFIAEKAKMVKLGENCVLNTDIQKLNIQNISIDNGGIIIYSELKGNSVLNIQKLK